MEETGTMEETPGSSSNGTKGLLLGILVAACLAISGWVLLTSVSHGERITATETRLDGIVPWLRRIDDKLDRVLERR
jgi:hypothetical protein